MTYTRSISSIYVDLKKDVSSNVNYAGGKFALTTVSLATLEGFTVPAGAVVLVSSLSHLAAVGTAAYAEDLVKAFKAVRSGPYTALV
jgi:hypothetical protein